MEQLVLVLRGWKSIPKPDIWKDDQTQQLTIELAAFEPVFQNFRSSYKLFLPVEESTYTQIEELIATVWGKPIKTLYVSRSDLEVTGVMRQTVENAHISVSQVSSIEL